MSFIANGLFVLELRGCATISEKTVDTGEGFPKYLDLSFKMERGRQRLGEERERERERESSYEERRTLVNRLYFCMVVSNGPFIRRLVKDKLMVFRRSVLEVAAKLPSVNKYTSTLG